MGSSSSRLASAPTRLQRPDRPSRPFLSSLLVCGGSTSHAPHEQEDDPSELLGNFIKHGEPVADELQSMTKESALASGARTGLTGARTEAGASSESSMIVRKDTSFGDNLINGETSKEGECLCKSKELVPPHRLTGDFRSNDTASTSCGDQSSSDQGSANARSCMEVVNGIGNRMEKDVSRVSAEVIHPSSLSHQDLGDSHSDVLSAGNHVSGVMAIHNSDPGSASDVSDSSSLLRDDSFQEATPPGPGFLVSGRERNHSGGNVLHVDLVSISSSSSSSSSSELSNREARQNSRRLFWDAFSRRSSRRHSDSQALVFSTDDADGLGSNDRWLVDFSGDFFDDGVSSSSGYNGSRIHNLNERRWQSRSEVLERLHGGRGRGNPQRSICPSGLHPNGTCSCESILMAEESGAHASVSRIVMLAEALFEVLDEIHRQPLSLSLSVVSLPAPEAVVNSLPIKYHMKPERTESGDDAAQCYICLSEYEEGDKIRVLPCHHEFHMSCVDKWLKEIHGVCPLCRGVVREGHTEGSVSTSETPSA